jgi:hypothetical protein
MSKIAYEKGVAHYLGLFLTEEEARQAYIVAKQNLGVS